MSAPRLALVLALVGSLGCRGSSEGAGESPRRSLEAPALPDDLAGVAAWNAARESATGELDLRDSERASAVLDGIDLHGLDLRDSNFAGASLEGADLHGARLDKADLTDADLGEADLRDAVLDHAETTGIDVRDVAGRGLSMRWVDLAGADLSGADLREGDLRGASFAGATLDDTQLDGADLRGADLRGADLSTITGERFDLRGAKADSKTAWPPTITHPIALGVEVDGVRASDEQLRDYLDREPDREPDTAPAREPDREPDEG